MDNKNQHLLLYKLNTFSSTTTQNGPKGGLHSFKLSFFRFLSIIIYLKYALETILRVGKNSLLEHITKRMPGVVQKSAWSGDGMDSS
jgi:hypothetical protein